jgi:hypothetical protein
MKLVGKAADILYLQRRRVVYYSDKRAYDVSAVGFVCVNPFLIAVLLTSVFWEKMSNVAHPSIPGGPCKTVVLTAVLIVRK